jgi:NADH-quinone oxidoreductase subunit H
MNTSLWPDLAMSLVFIGYAMVMLLSFGGLLTWVERKQSAVMADRIGANRAYIRIPFTKIKLVWLGLFHGMADGAKMLLKENFKPKAHDKVGYFLAPFIVFSPVLLVFAVVPFGGTIVPGQLIPALAGWFGDRAYPMQIATLDAGLLVVFAFSGLTIIGAMLAGWASENKFSLLGGLRAGSQMISYELVMGLTIMGLILVYGTVDLGAIVQKQSGTLFGVLPAWGIFYQPVAAFLFLTAAIAENKRIPFDLPEAESELIAGYFTEYSAMKLGLFMFSEFIQIAVVGALFATLFLGGYNLPFMSDAGFTLPGGQVIALSQQLRVPLQLLTFLGKVALMCVLQIQIRWTLPRFRYDQMLGLSWKLLLPLSLANLVATVVGVYMTGGAA